MLPRQMLLSREFSKPIEHCVLTASHAPGEPVSFSADWEAVYAAMGIDPSDKVPSRRLQLKQVYEHCLLPLDIRIQAVFKYCAVSQADLMPPGVSPA